MHYVKYLKYLVLTSISILILACVSDSKEPSKVVEKPEEAQTMPLRVACVGDSITEGFKLSSPSTESYPAQLSKLVSKGVEVKNFGIRGRSVIKDGEQSYWNAIEYKQSLNFNPEIVVIMLGSNDMKDANYAKRNNIISDYKMLIDSYKALSTKPIIYICFPTPSYGNIRGITNKRIVEVLIPMLKEVAKQNDVPIIDMHTLLSNKKELFPDTLHPNKEGARQMAEAVYMIIY